MTEEETLKTLKIYIDGVIGGVASGAYFDGGGVNIDENSLFLVFRSRYPGADFKIFERFMAGSDDVTGYHNR